MAIDKDKNSRNIAENKARWTDDPYFDLAESDMDKQWDFMYPHIKHCDFSSVLELAPGHGRNTEKLKDISKELTLVDLTEECIEHCRKRFSNYDGPCKIQYFINDGATLPMIAGESISFIYSFDSMVHFERFVIRGYLQEFARVMRTGGCGLIHFSNYGAQCNNPESNWLKNPHLRSTMSRDLFVQYCDEVGLRATKCEIVDWGGMKDLDCLSLFTKP